MPLNPLDAQSKPGRLPDAEAGSLRALLLANGFTGADVTKARSAAADDTDLQRRFTKVTAVEAKFTIGSNVTPQKRREFRIELETEYGRLLDAAQRYRDDADDSLETALTDAVARIHTNSPVNQLFKGNGPWKEKEELLTLLDARFQSILTLDEFRTQVFKRYNATYKVGGAAQGPPPLTALEQQAITAEKTNVNTQLAAWATMSANAQGCNINGTWGTCATGSVVFHPTQVTPRVWAALKKWWQTKPGAYVTPSDTTTVSMKMYRDVDVNTSATFNYHINVQ
ncbi:hypothetical protein ACTG9Q_27260 [Actinokineospora sp. 24-640]